MAECIEGIRAKKYPARPGNKKTFCLLGGEGLKVKNTCCGAWAAIVSGQIRFGPLGHRLRVRKSAMSVLALRI